MAARCIAEVTSMRDLRDGLSGIAHDLYDVSVAAQQDQLCLGFALRDGTRAAGRRNGTLQYEIGQRTTYRCSSHETAPSCVHSILACDSKHSLSCTLS